MMKQLLVAALATLTVSTSAMAASEVSFYQMTARNGPIMPVEEKWIAALEQKDFEFDATYGKACQAKPLYAKDTGKKLLHFPSSQFWRSLHDGDDTCVADTRNAEVISIISDGYDWCTRADDSAVDIAGFKQLTNAKIAGAKGVPFGPWTALYNKAHGTSHKYVGTPTSKVAAMMLLAGDVDIAVMQGITAKKHVRDGTVQCFATTADDSVVEMWPDAAEGMSRYKIMYVLVSNNLSEEELATIRTTIKSLHPVSQLESGFNIDIITTEGGEAAKKRVNDAIWSLVNDTAAAKDLD